MTYLRLLRAIHRALSWAMSHCDPGSRLWAELADLDGTLAFREIDYAKRVQVASGWRPVEVVNTRPSPSKWVLSEPTTTLAAGSRVTMTWRQS